MKATKIVATISDKRCEPDFLSALIESGVNVVRLNTAHMGRKGMEKVIDRVREISPYVAILMDTKGPEVRTTIVDEPIKFNTGDRFYMSGDSESKTTKECIFVSYERFVEDVQPGTDVLIDDGELEINVIERQGDLLVCEALNAGTLGARKTVNVPGVRMNLPSLSDRDRKNIAYAIEKKIDFIAHSFVRSARDMEDIYALLSAAGSTIKVIAKIENQEGVDNVDEILGIAYGLMVARGDLGIEVPLEKLPAIQRNLIRKCVENKKPVIIATQMLHSMIQHPRPTRAEVSDVANAIYYRTDALMLSGETANGLYPVEAVRTMVRIIHEAEHSKLQSNDIRVPFEGDDLDTTSFLAKQAVKSVNKLGVKAIVTDSFSGRTARILAAFRGRVPVHAICYNEPITRQLALSYGVRTEFQPPKQGCDHNLRAALERLVSEGIISMDDRVAYISGTIGRDGSSSNALEINTVENLMTNETL